MDKRNYIFIDSRQCTYFPSDNTYSVKLSEPITITQYIKLKLAQIPNVHLNIDSGVNNWIDVLYTVPFVGPTNYSFQIPKGNYTPQQLATQLQTLFNTWVDNNFTVTYNPITYGFTIITNTPAFFKILFSSGTHAQFSAWSQLGFNYNTDTLLSTSQNSTQAADLNSPNYVYINVKNLKSYPLRNSIASTMFAVVFSTAKGVIENWTELSNYEQILELDNKQVFQQFEISLNTTTTNILNAYQPYQTYGIPFYLIFEYI